MKERTEQNSAEKEPLYSEKYDMQLDDRVNAQLREICEELGIDFDQFAAEVEAEVVPEKVEAPKLSYQELMFAAGKTFINR